jgi:hypothetical protein
MKIERRIERKRVESFWLSRSHILKNTAIGFLFNRLVN